MTQKDVLLFNYDKGNKKKYTKIHTRGFTHYKSSPISLHVVKTHPEFYK